MFLTGDNRNSQLSKKGNRKITGSPLKSDLDVSLLLSFSVAHNHSAWVNKNNDAFLSTSNGAPINIRNKNGQKCKFTSAVCGEYYTLYLAFDQSKNDSFQLIYENSNDEFLFLNTGDRKPQAIFGGYEKSAAIDSEGAILIVNPNESLINPTFLPDKDKAISVACCNNFFIALGSSGKVYKYDISSSTNPNFTLINELKGETFIDISGTNEHCFAVSKKGKVFGYGSNIFSRLGISDYNGKFCIIDTLNKYKITGAFAGFDHSLFITSEGESLACGYNDYGQTLIFQEPHNEKVCPPVIVPYKGKVKFFVLGYGITVAFIDCQVPPNIPNKVIKNINSNCKVPETKNSKLDSNSKNQELEQAKKEIKRLLQVQDELNKRIKELEKQQKQQQKETKKGQQDTNENKKGIQLLDVSELDKLQTVKKLGRGATSEVFEVTKPERYAMKVFDIELCKNGDKDDDDDDDDDDNIEIDYEKMRKFMQEYEILNRLDHPNILKTFGFCLGDPKHSPSILLEYCPSNLKKRIKKLTDSERISIIFDVSSAMKQIHSLGIIHRDLKLENILLDADNNPKVADFGLATLVDPSESITLTQMTGTLNYMAPELINGKTDYNEKVDIYSFGVILYLVLSHGEFPKIGIVDIGKGKKAQIPSNFTSFSTNLINKCWSFKPDERPSFADIYDSLIENRKKLI
ncbi:hypothetical protein M9Y10_038366 [Tritrichomonas musculus]|uniref:Protein kinase domain-containing protein n=1 Tax=Tritrichomonas musculus TaxID=1915356 RepID=A0ABR2K9Z8_9EUKA